MQGVEPARVGKYELLRRIAVGGMGEVFLARERGVAGFDRIVVVKRLLPELAEKPDLVDMFIDEARITGQVSHPNIVQIHDFGHADGAYFLTMEYVAGQNLSRIADRAEQASSGLPLAMAVHVVAEMARGLDAAHRASDADGRALGIVHRDVSPHNVIVSYGGDVKLMDFGIAKAANKTHRTEAGTIRGKLSYMSPEQARGDELDVRSDVFAAGVVLWELTVGEDLFTGDGVVDTIRAVCESPIPRPSERVGDYPPELERIVMAALERDRDQRTATAGELGAALRSFLVDRGIHVDRDELGRFVADLFPDDLEALSRDELSAGTSSMALTRELDNTASVSIAPSRSEPLARPSGTPAASEPPSPSGTPAASEPPSPSGGRVEVGGRRRLWPLAALAIAIGAATVAVIISTRANTSNTSSSSSPADQPPTADLAMLTSASASADAGAADTPRTAALSAIPIDATASTADAAPRSTSKRDHDKHTTRSTRDASVVAAAATLPRLDAAGAAAAVTPPRDVPTFGTLIVGTRVAWATITVGSHTGRTQFRKELPAGTYALTADVSGNGGRFTTTAVIAAGKITKCFVEQEKVACRSPG